MAMDWFTWLSKTGLDPSLVYEYGLAFSQNELEQDDIPYFNHEFLHSMGISIAKHRLEILKVAKRENNLIGIIMPLHPVSRILIAIKRTKKCLSKYVRTWISRREESALALVVHSHSYNSAKWKSAMVKRNKRRSSTIARETLLLTNGSPAVFRVARSYSFSSSSAYEMGKDGGKKTDEDFDEYWGSVAEEIRWDTMFQNLKPT